MIAGRGEAEFGVQAFEAAEFAAVEVGIVVVAAGFENDHFVSSGGKDGSGYTAAGAGADDAYIAGESRLLLRRGDMEFARRVGALDSDRAGVAHVFPDGIGGGVRV